MAGEAEKMSEEQEEQKPERKPEKKEEKESEKSDSPAVAGDMIKQANEAADRLEEQNKVLQSLIQRQEELKVVETLGGTAAAGQPKQSQEDKEIAETKKMLEGTGFEDIDLTHK